MSLCFCAIIFTEERRQWYVSLFSNRDPLTSILFLLTCVLETRVHFLAPVICSARAVVLWVLGCTRKAVREHVPDSEGTGLCVALHDSSGKLDAFPTCRLLEEKRPRCFKYC